MTNDTFERKHAEGFYVASDIEELYKLQDGRCYFCDVNLDGAFHIDHLLAVSKSGTNWPGNLSLTCATCNKRKYNHDAARLWRQLRAERGNDWVKRKMLSNRSATARKSQLTRQRKLERMESLELLEQEVAASLSRYLEAHCLESEAATVQVKQVSCYVSITFNHRNRVELPAPTQAELARWTAQDFETIASSLVALERLAGYLKPRKFNANLRANGERLRSDA